MLKIKSVFMRFVKGALAGAATSMSMVALNTPTVWSDFNLILDGLAVAGTFGALTGLLLAFEKWASWKE